MCVRQKLSRAHKDRLAEKLDLLPFSVENGSSWEKHVMSAMTIHALVSSTVDGYGVVHTARVAVNHSLPF